jgi:hypothetical protein
MSDSDTDWLSVGSPSPVPAGGSKHNVKPDLDNVEKARASVGYCDTSNTRIAEKNGTSSVIVRNTRKLGTTNATDCSPNVAPLKDEVIDASPSRSTIARDGKMDVLSLAPRPLKPIVKPLSLNVERTSDVKGTRATGPTFVNAVDKKRLVPEKGSSNEPKPPHDPKRIGFHIGPVAFGQQLSLGSMYLRQCVSLLNSSLLFQTNESLSLGLLPILDHEIKESIVRMMEIKSQLKEVQDFLKTVVDESVVAYQFSPYVGDMPIPNLSTVFHPLNDASQPIGTGRPIAPSSCFHPYLRP